MKHDSDNSNKPAEESRPRKLARTRLFRLALKELRETLRDRRTIMTLVLMPLLTYPLIGVIVSRFLLSQSEYLAPADGRIRIACQTEAEGLVLQQLLASGKGFLKPKSTGDSQDEGESKAKSESNSQTVGVENHEFIISVPEDQQIFSLEQALQDGEADVGVQIEMPDWTFDDGTDSNQQSKGKSNTEAERSVKNSASRKQTRLRTNDVIEIQIVTRTSSWSQQAGEKLKSRLDAFNQFAVQALLRRHRISFRPPANYHIRTISPAQDSQKAEMFSLAALIPLMLILMTVTGAVYPAIDLTAGERERNTLETLIAAPISRLHLLFAKYVAVLTVAMLTAVVNLGAMMLTISAIGFDAVLLSDEVNLPLLFIQILGLLFVFACFFSAVLLCVTSSARSFKEAQAYLIPLVLGSIAPGLFSLSPSLKLTGIFTIIPLINIVLLARDLLNGVAHLGSSFMVVCSTLLYSVLVLKLATSLFGTDAILYGSQGNWKGIVQRPKQSRTYPHSQLGWGMLLLLFPLHFHCSQFLGRVQSDSMVTRLLVSGILTCLLFGLLPWIVSWYRKISLRETFALNPISIRVLIPSLILGCTLWPFAFELVMWAKEQQLATLDFSKLERFQPLLESWNQIPLGWILLSLAVLPGVCEEWFFRGFLFGSLYNSQRPGRTIVLTGILFGLFHLIVTDSLAVERFLPSTFLGLILGWIRYSTGSVIPGICLHICHNGLLLTIVRYEKQIAEWGVGIQLESHLPFVWLVGASILVFISLWLIDRWGMRDARTLRDDA